MCDLFTLNSSLHFLAFLLSVFLFPFFHLSDEQQPELNKKFMENLCDSATNGGEGTYDRPLPPHNTLRWSPPPILVVRPTCHHCLTISSLLVLSEVADFPFLLHSVLPSVAVRLSIEPKSYVELFLQPSLRSRQCLPCCCQDSLLCLCSLVDSITAHKKTLMFTICSRVFRILCNLRSFGDLGFGLQTVWSVHTFLPDSQFRFFIFPDFLFWLQSYLFYNFTERLILVLPFIFGFWCDVQ